MSPSVGNYLVDVKSFEQLAIPTIKHISDKSKVNRSYCGNLEFLSLPSYPDGSKGKRHLEPRGKMG